MLVWRACSHRVDPMIPFHRPVVWIMPFPSDTERLGGLFRKVLYRAVSASDKSRLGRSSSAESSA